MKAFDYIRFFDESDPEYSRKVSKSARTFLACMAARIAVMAPWRDDDCYNYACDSGIVFW